MTLKAIINALDEVPEADRQHYAEAEDGPLKGKFLCQIEPVSGYALEDVKGLRQVAQDRKAKHEKSARQLAQFTDLFDSLDDARAAHDALAGAGSGDGEDEKRKADVQARIDAATRQLQAKHTKELEGLTGKLTKRERQLERELVENRALLLLPDGTKKKQVLPYVRMVCRPIENEDGEYDLVVIDESSGQPRMSERPGSTQNMQLPELIALMRKDDDWAGAFPGTRATGGGATGGDANTAGGGSRLDDKAKTQGLPATDRLRAAMAREADRASAG